MVQSPVIIEKINGLDSSGHTSKGYLLKCRECGKEFYKEGSYLAMFCSKGCLAKGRGRKRKTAICKWCGEQFYTLPSRLAKGWGQFCSKACHGKYRTAQKKYVDLVCEHCGKSFRKRESAYRSQPAKYCSRLCANHATVHLRSGKNNYGWNSVPVHCAQCGGRFYRQPSRFKFMAGELHFCSTKCWALWIKGENNPVWNSEIRRCKQCGNEFFETLSRIKEGRGQFCSAPCRNTYFREKGILAGSHNPNWIDGRSFEPYPIEFNEILKRKTRERDKFICQNCGTQESELDTKLSIHHIDYDKNNCSENNLISLCRPCNSKVNGDRNEWIKFFQAKLTDKKNRKEWSI